MEEEKNKTNKTNKSIMIATPSYNGQVYAQYAISLSDTVHLLRLHNYEVIIRMGVGSSLIPAERNRLTEQFWQSDCDYMLCIDADLGWPPQAVLAMLEQDKEFVCGVYPARRSQGKEFTFRPIADENGLIKQSKHLLAMEYVPAGFMLIKRQAFAKMRDFYPDLYYKPKDPRSKEESAYCFFSVGVWDGEFWGEDYTFCRYVRNAGIKIWADPVIEFDHAGDRGMLFNCLRKANGEGLINDYVISNPS